MPELSILMPVYNERATLEQAIDQVLRADHPGNGFELIVVDDGSTDGTGELLEARSWPPQVRLIRHERNLGKGAAIRSALGIARGRWSVVMDADLEYEPENIRRVIEPLADDRAIAVFGARNSRVESAGGLWYLLGKKLVTLVANLLYGSRLRDVMTAHKAMSTELFRSLDLREQGFAIEPEIAARLLLRGIEIQEVPVAYRARGRKQGKKLTTRDGPRVLHTLIRCRFRRRK